MLEPNLAERRRVEEELRQSRAFFESLLESAPDAIIAIDQAGRMSLVNSQAEKMFGYRRPELLGHSIEMLIPGRFRHLHVQHRANYSQAPTTRPMGAGLDLWAQRKDGTEFPVEISLSPVKTERGAWTISIIRDVTDRRRAEEQLRQSEERFRRLIEQVHDYAIFGLDSEGYVTSWNEGAARLNGYRADEIIGKHFSVFFPLADIQGGAPDEELRVAAAQGHYEVEAMRVRKDGTPYWADVAITALHDPQGHLRGFSKVIRDITARKETQEQIRRLNVELEQRVQELAAVNQELEAFSYSVSHDLRAPLRAIAGFSQALAEDYDATLDDQGKDYTRRIIAATQRLTQLIDDLLMLSRVTRSEMRWDTSVDLSAMAESIAAQLESSEPERHGRFVIQPSLAARGDPHLLHVALDNLLANAWKFTSKVPEARIEFGADGKENGSTVYFVRDNGAGFDMAFASKLFGPFQRLHSGSEFPGTGIGLATVQRIIHRHGGRVWAKGEVGKGATVYFTLKNGAGVS